MFLIIFFCFVAIGAFIAFRLLAPEMYVNVGQPRFHFPWSRSHRSEVQEIPMERKADGYHLSVVDVPRRPEDAEISVVEKVRIMEGLLADKNKLIDRLQKQLDSERSHRKNFEKVRSIMDEEIQRLKDQVKTTKQGV